ncbi:MAG TPA: hypothetical protein PLQ97_15335 [Myxococcota bacterium]|nr:hypothetical protein [Myxococcota bacterium]HQK52585.1 hypothetical protein [Myxococcota bacterium]
MEQALTLLFLAVPVLILVAGVLAVRFPGWGQRVPWPRVVEAGLWGVLVLVVAGEVRNGLWKAPGFHGGLWVLGALAWVLALVVVRSPEVRDRWASRISVAWGFLREDLAGPPGSGPSSRLSPFLALLASLVLFYVPHPVPWTLLCT